MKKISILCPSLEGGGAEKIINSLLRSFMHSNSLSRIYIGKSTSADHLYVDSIYNLLSYRSLFALPRLLLFLRSDRATTYLFTLGFINLLPFVRLLKPKARLVVRLGNTISPELPDTSVLRLLHLVRLAVIFSASNAIICQCEYMMEDLTYHFPRLSKKCSVIYNSVSTPIPSRLSLPDLFRAHNIPFPPAPFIFTASTHKPQKDLVTVLKALSLLSIESRPLCIIAGVSAANKEFNALMADCNLNDTNVVRLGLVSSVQDFIYYSSACFLCSTYEGFSNFALEASSYSKPLILTICPGGNRDLAKYYSNISWFNIGDFRTLASLIRNIQINDDIHAQTPSLPKIFSQSFMIDKYCKTLL